MPTARDPHPVPFPHAFAAIDSSGAVLAQQGDVGRVFPLASVTKLLTALGVHLAAEQGLLSLDQPAGPPGATIRHLLAHASGLAEEGDGSVVAEAPEAKRIYSNQGYDLLGRELEAATGVALADWVRTQVATPLGAPSLTVPGGGAHSGRGNAMDLALLAQELLLPEVLPATAVDALHEPAFPGLRGVLLGYGMQRDNAWGLGGEIRGHKQPHWTAPGASPLTFGHFGVSGSFLWADPEAEIAGVFLGAEPFGPWHKENWPALGAAAYPTS